MSVRNRIRFVVTVAAMFVFWAVRGLTVSAAPPSLQAATPASPAQQATTTPSATVFIVTATLPPSPTPTATLPVTETTTPTVTSTVPAAILATAVAPSATPAAKTPTPTERTYTVQAGDTLRLIAAKFYGNAARYTTIQKANNLADSAVLRIGMVLVVPVLPEVEGTATPVVVLSPTAIFLAPAPTIVLPLTFQSPPPAATTPLPILRTDPTAQATLAASPKTPPPANSGPSPFAPLISTTLYILGTICLLGALVCAILSADTYQRAKRYERRRSISGRVRVED